MHDAVVIKLRAAIDGALKAKNLDQVIKNRTLLQNHAHSTPAASAEITHYLASVDHKYGLMLQTEVENHIKLTKKSFQTVTQWLTPGNGMAEFENEYFSEDVLSKEVEHFREGDSTETEEEENEESEEEAEETGKQSLTVAPRRAAREWKKCEHEVTYLSQPKFSNSADVPAFLAVLHALRPAVLARLELEEVRRMIKVRHAGRRYARVRAALICGDAVIVLRHYQALHEDATQLRNAHPDHPATEIFAAHAEALVHMIEERRTALETQCEEEKERRLSGIKEVMKDVRETREKEEKIWKDTKERADAVNRNTKG